MSESLELFVHCLTHVKCTNIWKIPHQGPEHTLCQNALLLFVKI